MRVCVRVCACFREIYVLQYIVASLQCVCVYVCVCVSVCFCELYVLHYIVASLQCVAVVLMCDMWLKRVLRC